MKPILLAVGGLLVIGACAFLFLSRPHPLHIDDLPDHRADPVNGETMFWAGGCASCHAAPDGEERLTLGGGLELRTPFGLFRAPNISPDSNDGIGQWTTLEFVNAMARGLSPKNEHYYPAFPYPHYQNMSLGDLIDLKSFMDTLPAAAGKAGPHDLQFPYSVRRGVGLWKTLYARDNVTAPPADLPTPALRGHYLVRGPGHCGACHTPRDRFGGEIAGQFLAGADALELEAGSASAARIPNITPHTDGIGSWSESDIAYSLESGFDPDFDSFGGSMVHVQENMSRLPAADRAAIAAYLKTIPAVASQAR